MKNSKKPLAARFFAVFKRIWKSIYKFGMHMFFHEKAYVFPHNFPSPPKVFHKSYSFAQARFAKFFTSCFARGKVYHAVFRTPQAYLRQNNKFFCASSARKCSCGADFRSFHIFRRHYCDYYYQIFYFLYFFILKERFFRYFSNIQKNRKGKK